MVTLDLARSIARAWTLDDREQLLAAVPEHFRALVTQTASLMVADQIASLRALDARRAAFEHVPSAMLELVQMHVRRAFLARAEIKRRQMGFVDQPALDFAEAEG